MTPIILSAPSGCGKTTIAKELVTQIPHLQRVVTCTTREKREGEQDGKDYFFLSEEMFQNKIKSQEFLEWAKVHQHYYGTLKNTLDGITAHGDIPLLVIEVQGHATWKQLMPHALSIFIQPESMEVLRKWLTARHKDTAEDIKLRLHNAQGELARALEYDYRVVNRDGRIQETVQEIQRIIEVNTRKLTP